MVTIGRLAAFGILGGFLANACSGNVQGEGESVSARSDDILNGTVPPAGTDEAQGYVLVSHSGGICSGTLLRNDMVLTARHCVTTDGTIAGPVDSNPANFFLTMGTQSRDASRIFANVTTVDSAIIETSVFFAMNGKRYDYNRGIYAGTNASLLNATLPCFGYGRNTCSLDAGSAGSGVLRTANLQVTSTTTSLISYSTNSLGQNFWKGDSGGSCFSSGLVVGITSTCSCGSICNQQGAQSFRSWVLGNFLATATSTITTANSSNTTGNRTLLDNPDANANSAAILQVTQNWNPVGSSGVYNVHNVGVSYVSTSSKWAVQNKDGVAMPLGASFNVSAGGTQFVHTASTANISAHISRIDNALLNGLPNQTLVMTPNESGAANNHATGIFYDTSVAKWSVYNEDLAAMTPNAKFNIRVVTTGESYYKHTTTTANVFGPWTYLDQPNLNGQPSAQIFFAHDYGAAGFGGVAINHPLGVFYDTNAAKWAIFTQDGAGMPLNAIFHILIRP